MTNQPVQTDREMVGVAESSNCTAAAASAGDGGGGMTLWDSPAPFTHTLSDVIILSVIRYAFTICGVTGNLLLVYVIYRYKTFHTTGYAFMAHLSLGDVNNSVWCAVAHTISLYSFLRPAATAATFTNIVPFDWLGIAMLYGYNVVVSLMFIISINRMCSVVFYRRYKQLFTRRRCIVLCILPHVFAAAMSVLLLPSVNAASYTYYPRLWVFAIDFNRDHWLAPQLFYFYQVMATLTVVTMTTVYAIIFKKLRQTQRRLTETSHTRKSTVTATARAKKDDQTKRENILLTLQFTVVTLIFVVAWIVFSIYTFTINVVDDVVFMRWCTAVYNVMLTVNFTINPLVYIVINKRLRQHMLRAILLTPQTQQSNTPFVLAVAGPPQLVS